MGWAGSVGQPRTLGGPQRQASLALEDSTPGRFSLRFEVTTSFATIKPSQLQCLVLADDVASAALGRTLHGHEVALSARCDEGVPWARPVACGAVVSSSAGR
ncbi:hypothetical protein GA0115261_101069 [Streptomyces sp. OspMP-M43]|nr:hypothetical protein GA0115261_101069 [Streptomyces sp. OspMP-M43]